MRGPTVVDAFADVPRYVVMCPNVHVKANRIGPDLYVILPNQLHPSGPRIASVRAGSLPSDTLLGHAGGGNSTAPTAKAVLAVALMISPSSKRLCRTLPH